MIKMYEVQTVRALVNQRLAAAAEEIFGLFERTIAEYEEELCRSKEKNERQQKLLDAVLKPEVRLHRADVQQQLVVKEEVPPEQQEWSPSLDQEDPPEPPHIKEEQEELWTSQEGEQLQGLEEADITKFLFTPVPVKSEDDEEKPQSSQLHQRQTEQKETGADGEGCGGPEPARNPHQDPQANIVYEIEDSHPDPELGPETEDSDDYWTETGEPQSGLKSQRINKVSKSGLRCNTETKPFSCSDCGRRFRLECNLNRHVKTHTSNKAFCCSICGKSFSVTNRLETHMRIHTGYKPFSCSVCGKTFNQNGHLTIHMVIHKAERPFGCSVCGRRFKLKGNLRGHMVVHTQEKNFHCTVCDRRFAWAGQVKRHGCVGLETSKSSTDRPFSCSVCAKRFTLKGNLKKHMVAVHTHEKKFHCIVCDQRFSWDVQLTRHKLVCPQSLQLHQNQTEENGEAEPGASSSTELKLHSKEEVPPEQREASSSLLYSLLSL